MPQTHYLHGRKDRLGANILNYAAQLCIAHFKSAVVRYHLDKLPYADSVFVRALLECARQHSRDLGTDSISKQIFVDEVIAKMAYSRPFEIGRSLAFRAAKRWNPQTEFTDRGDFISVLSSSTRLVRSDLISYFREHFFKIADNSLRDMSNDSGFTCEFDPKKSIVIHLRLEDVRFRPDYDGRICSKHYRSRLEQGLPCFGDFSGPYNMQSPLSLAKISRQIDLAMAENPGREPIVLTAPGERMDGLDLRYIGSDDPDRDLFMLSNAEVAILSRSTFALSSLLFGSQKRVYVPTWGHAACLGLDTNLDRSRHTYFF